MNGGERWAKIQGIPSAVAPDVATFSSIRHSGNIYAATTEGFWMSTNGGKTWSLTTSRELEINSIAVHPGRAQPHIYRDKQLRRHGLERRRPHIPAVRAGTFRAGSPIL